MQLDKKRHIYHPRAFEYQHFKAEVCSNNLNHLCKRSAQHGIFDQSFSPLPIELSFSFFPDLGLQELHFLHEKSVTAGYE